MRNARGEPRGAGRLKASRATSAICSLVHDGMVSCCRQCTRRRKQADEPITPQRMARGEIAAWPRDLDAPSVAAGFDPTFGAFAIRSTARAAVRSEQSVCVTESTRRNTAPRILGVSSGGARARSAASGLIGPNTCGTGGAPTWKRDEVKSESELDAPTKNATGDILKPCGQQRSVREQHETAP